MCCVCLVPCSNNGRERVNSHGLSSSLFVISWKAVQWIWGSLSSPEHFLYTASHLIIGYTHTHNTPHAKVNSYEVCMMRGGTDPKLYIIIIIIFCTIHDNLLWLVDSIHNTWHYVTIVEWMRGPHIDYCCSKCFILAPKYTSFRLHRRFCPVYITIDLNLFTYYSNPHHLLYHVSYMNVFCVCHCIKMYLKFFCRLVCVCRLTVPPVLLSSVSAWG
jgi:hypothetical protein